MAKELPYFKFEPGQWENGTIQICSREAKGLFIDLCSMYWQRLGDLPYKLAVQKLCGGDASALDSIIDEQVIAVSDGMICIDFLNEQLQEFEKISKSNSENALIGWQKRKNNANGMRAHSERNAIREEEKREDKIKVDEIKKAPPIGYDIPFKDGCLKMWNEWEVYRKELKKKLTPSTALKQIKFLGGRPELEVIAIINQSITNGWTGLFELKNNGNRTNNQGKVRRADAIIDTPTDYGKF